MSVILPDRISYSSWQSYRNFCQHRWKLDVIDGHGGKAYGVHLDFGTSVHGTIELLKPRKDPVPLEEGLALFERNFKDLFEKNSSKYKKEDADAGPDEFIEAGKVILSHLDDCEQLRESQVVYNEHKLLIPLSRTDDVKMNFKGYIDMVIKTKDKRGNPILYIIDFKTCSWGWTIDKKQDRELQFQLLLYKHFLCKEFNLRHQDVRTAFILLKRKPPIGKSPIEFFPVSAGPISVQRAVDQLNADVTDMDIRAKEGEFVKNRNSCVDKWGGRCPYLDTPLCPSEKHQ